jgi:hypothetical protein
MYIDFIDKRPAMNIYLSTDNTTFYPAAEILTRNVNDTIYVKLVEESNADNMTQPAVLQIQLDDGWTSVGSPGNTVYQVGGRWYINYSITTDVANGTSRYFLFYGITPDRKGEAEVNAIIYNSGVNSANIHELILNIINTKPVVASASITPSPAYSCYNLTCVNGTASDADGDTVTFRYRWFQNGVVMPSQTSQNLSGEYFNATDNIMCEIMPFDGIDEGDPVNSPVLTITQSDNDGPCNESCSHDIDCVSDDCCVGFCQNYALSCCGEDGCETGEGYSNCPSDCCDLDCTASDDNTCHSVCAGYNGCGTVSSECNGDTINDCGDLQGDCVGCVYSACIDYTCTDYCYGSRWRYADDVDNTCVSGECTSDTCSWSNTCDATYAGGCSDWECDDTNDCTVNQICSSLCHCMANEVKVNSNIHLTIEGGWEKKEWVWLAKG